MLLICNKHIKKLFPAWAAPGAVACHPNLGINNSKISGFSYISLYMPGYRVLEFDDPPAAETHQMMVLGSWLRLVVMMGVIKMEFFDQALFL